MASFLHSDRPILTVMIQANTPERAIELIEKANAVGTDAFGIQIDKLLPEYRSPEIYTRLLRAAGNKAIYVTNYPHWNVQENITDAICVEQMRELMLCGGTMADIPMDLFDMREDQVSKDSGAVKKQKALANDFHKMRKEILFSTHTGSFLPPQAVLSLAREEHARGADIAKIVTLSEDDTQLRQNLKAALLLKEKLQKKFLFLTSGAYCTLHRRVGPALGSALFLTVVEYDALATPAQPLLTTARRLLTDCGFEGLPAPGKEKG